MSMLTGSEIQFDDNSAVADLEVLTAQQTRPEHYPWADRVEADILIYGERFETACADGGKRRDLASELASALSQGPGVVVIEGAFPDADVVDRASHAFGQLIDEQKQAGRTAGDHFAQPGANDRVWGALDKLALRHPGVFADYYANDALAVVSTAWLGPGYQVTSQVNVVNPGGIAQVPHRDYHLGFMSREQARQFPLHMHRLSPALTLQGAVAHTDMPVESGPTMYLPYSQQFDAGYLAYHRQEFIDYFRSHHVQLPLRQGDAAFFNPAVFHAAGSNRTTNIRRMANLLQVSSAFGRAMEIVDRAGMCRALYPILLERQSTGATPQWIENVVAACAEGYPFPTSLDRDPPVGGLAPQSQAGLLKRALGERWDSRRLVEELAAQQRRQTATA